MPIIAHNGTAGETSLMESVRVVSDLTPATILSCLYLHSGEYVLDVDRCVCSSHQANTCTLPYPAQPVSVQNPRYMQRHVLEGTVNVNYRVVKKDRYTERARGL